MADIGKDRIGEGLRLLEDISRFIINDASLSAALKSKVRAFDEITFNGFSVAVSCTLVTPIRKDGLRAVCHWPPKTKNN